MNQASVPDSYKCSHCGHVYIDFKEDGLAYHRNEYRTNKHGNRTSNEIIDGKFTDQFHHVRKNIMSARCEIIRDIAVISKTMLDIGAGGGSFVNMVRNKFNHLEIDCQEISNICAKNLIDYGHNVYHGNINEIQFDKCYDLVTCWHVLEHIKDLHAFVDTVDRITKRYLILEVPIKRSLRYPNDGGWDGHYHYFSTESMKLLFAETSFRFIDISTPGIQEPSMTVILQK
jgi:hypothetical protein